jgi:Ca2+-binding EF-hand superfamily protein
MRRTFPLPFAAPIAALILSVGVSGCGSSAPGLKEGIDGAFIRAAATWDLNHDGNVTCDEWKQYAASIFKEVDLNHDGKLSPEEFDRLVKIDRLFLTANFAYYDADHKGYVTQADFVDKPNPAFLELDKENTCVIKSYQLRAAISDDGKKSASPGMTPSSSPPGSRGGH